MREENTPGFGVAPGTDLGATRNPQRPLARCPADWTTIQRPYLASANNPSHKIAQKNDAKRFTLFTKPQIFRGTPLTPSVLIVGQSASGSPVISLKHGSTNEGILTGMVITSQSPDTVFSANASVVSSTATTITMSENATAKTNSHNQFVFKVASTSASQYLPTTTEDGNLNASEAAALRDPALWGGDYLQVKNLLSIKVNPGYNSPTDIAVQLTEELNARDDIEFMKYETVNTANNASEDVVLSMISETPTYKHYHCATAENFQQNYYLEWAKTDGTWDIDEAYHYFSSYQFIGIKRPELYSVGCKINRTLKPFFPDDDGFTTDNRQYLIKDEDIIFVTNFGFDDDNLLKWKEFFDTQAIYPELFDDFEQNDLPVSSRENRFFHMNLYDDFLEGARPDAKFSKARENKAVPPLGYDLYDQTISASYTSFPCFIDYNDNCSHLKADHVGFTLYD